MMVIIKHRLTLAALIPVCLLYTKLTVARNAEWKSNYILYSADVAKAPDNFRLNYYAGTELARTMGMAETNPEAKHQLMDDAIRYFRKAIAIYPDFADLQNNTGNAFYNNTQYDSAEKYELRSLQLSPANYEALATLSSIYLAKKQYLQAITYAKLALAVKDAAGPNYNLGIAYLSTNTTGDSAAIYLNKALAMQPADAAIYIQMGVACAAAKHYLMAESYFKKAVELDPGNRTALFDLGVAYSRSQMAQQAIDVFKKIVAADRQFAKGYAALAECYYSLKEYDTAIQAANMAIAINPDYAVKQAKLFALCYYAKGITDSSKKYANLTQVSAPSFSMINKKKQSDH